MGKMVGKDTSIVLVSVKDRSQREHSSCIKYQVMVSEIISAAALQASMAHRSFQALERLSNHWEASLGDVKKHAVLPSCTCSLAGKSMQYLIFLFLRLSLTWSKDLLCL